MPLFSYFTATLIFFFGIDCIASLQIAQSVEEIKTITGIPNVTLIPNNATVFTISGTGESSTYFSMVVPETGFEYTIDAPSTPEMRWKRYGLFTVKFDTPIFHNLTFLLYKMTPRTDALYMWTGTKEEDIALTDKYNAITTFNFTVFPNGTAKAQPVMWLIYGPTIPFPLLNKFPSFGTNERILNVKISWTNISVPAKLKLPMNIRFLKRDFATTTDVSTTTTQQNLNNMTTSNYPFLRSKWWLIVDIGITVVVISGTMIAFLVYQLFQISASMKSPDQSTAMSTQKSENANSGTITSKELPNLSSAIQES